MKVWIVPMPPQSGGTRVSFMQVELVGVAECRPKMDNVSLPGPRMRCSHLGGCRECDKMQLRRRKWLPVSSAPVRRSADFTTVPAYASCLGGSLHPA